MKPLLLCLALSCATSFAQSKPLISDDFESGFLDTKLWETRITGVATIQVQQNEAAHGKYALQVHYPDMADRNSYAFAVMPHLPDTVKGHFFGRAYVKIAPGLPTSHTVMLWGGAAAWPLSKFEEIGVYQNKLQPSYQENKSARGQGRGEDVRHGDPLPAGKWFLLEWEFNDNPTTLTIWVDGQPTPVSAFEWPHGSDTKSGLVGAFEEFGLGARVWGAVPQGFDIFYDDIALDTQRLGPVK